jgi:hypothetical protein
MSLPITMPTTGTQSTSETIGSPEPVSPSQTPTHQVWTWLTPTQQQSVAQAIVQAGRCLVQDFKNLKEETDEQP